jgi:Uma2 family endonuclease
MAKEKPSPPENLAEMLEQLGDVPLERIRARPAPGTATEEDVLKAYSGVNRRLCELIDGVLVDKAMGTQEALLAGIILQLLWNYVQPRRLGLLLGADGMLRLMPGLVRIPDVSFLAKHHLVHGRLPATRIADLAPDLAVEVLSESNTGKEIQRKLRDYFFNGTQLAWLVQPKTQTAEIYTSPTDKTRIAKNQTLKGDPVVPGFTLSLKELFSRTCVEEESD